ncbi:Zinc-binding alcohol dehydrogenase domain-containing protein [Lachnellula hyalina]|uniref:Zinc-binding alcohol dehydrogenase domain-containing protein n=1 Tax=Lachnellula hyalina TaxID=1316788 RepID=A0A8H8R7N2_9HELO|nr:Zinc-binding alcohol dehydrogenase domain-containing protein [Lachnellula hyalina]TVY29959.1 Zinc-binding alcohol dehydrogenase domain-containing protein [Lachnellula hyalina]
MPSNTAAWLTAAKSNPLEVKTAAYTSPGDHEIVIKNGALAVNPIDWKIQDYAFFPLKYPTILGQDVAGTVVEVGSAVSRFSKGDRVLGHALSLANQKPSDGGFQEYTIVLDNLASQIPSTLPFENATVLPLGLSTAAAGLFPKEYLALQHPSLDPKPTGQTLLVWGGASSVGSNAIQLAVAAGYEVVTTASPNNFDYTKKLGASQVFDYHSKSVVADLVEALKGKTVVGVLDAIGANGAIQNSLDILAQVEGNKVVATVLQPPENIPTGTSAKWIQAFAIKDNGVGKAVYEDFLPRALAGGNYVAAPEPYIVGKGLENVQAGIETQKKGVSAKKVVITL